MLDFLTFSLALWALLRLVLLFAPGFPAWLPQGTLFGLALVGVFHLWYAQQRQRYE